MPKRPWTKQDVTMIGPTPCEFCGSRKCRCEEYRPTIRVYLECCKDWADEASVTVENIEEDIEGRDVLTFRCPQCGESHRSLRVGRG